MRASSLTHILLVATRNLGKLNELAVLLAGIPAKLLSLNEVCISDGVEETGATFKENAVIKASQYADMSGLTTLSDDSGLEVDALDGEPGINSARYAGPDADDAQRIAFLLKKLKGIPIQKRQARFRCAIAVAKPAGPVETFEGSCEGLIGNTPLGKNGFGYDPAFLFPNLGKTMAELSTEEKNTISHRGIAAGKAVAALSNPCYFNRPSASSTRNECKP